MQQFWQSLIRVADTWLDITTGIPVIGSSPWVWMPSLLTGMVLRLGHCWLATAATGTKEIPIICLQTRLRLLRVVAYEKVCLTRLTLGWAGRSNTPKHYWIQCLMIPQSTLALVVVISVRATYACNRFGKCMFGFNWEYLQVRKE